MPDYVHPTIAIAPKHAVSQVVGYIHGKSAVHLARLHGERKHTFIGRYLWVPRIFVSTVGRDEAVIRDDSRSQGKENARLERMALWR